MPTVAWLRGVSAGMDLALHQVQEHRLGTIKIWGWFYQTLQADKAGCWFLLKKQGVWFGVFGFGCCFFFLSFPKLLTVIVYILQYYYSCYELPKAATSKYCRAHVVPAQIIATNAGLPNLGLISLFK